MKKLFVILSILIATVSFANAQSSKTEEILTTADENPEYVGGIKAMFDFIGQNLKYPAKAQKANIQGKVFVQFVVRKDGSTSNMKILKGIGYGCDEETKRVIALMKWKPAIDAGKPVNSYFTLPVMFSMEGKKGKKGK